MTATFNVSQVATGAQPFALTTADLNGDGNLDLVTSFRERNFSENQSGVTVLLGNGTGQFAVAKNYSVSNQLAPVYINDIAVADVNRDGKLDLVTVGLGSVTQQQGSFLFSRELSIISVLKGDGAGGFSAAKNTFIDRIGDGSLGADSLAIADFNGDGNLDVTTVADGSISAGAEDPANKKLVAVLLGDGTGNFSNQRNVAIPNNTSSVAIGDFNSDGRADLAVGGSPESGSESIPDITILLNDGTASFNSIRTVPTEFGGSSGLLAGDFNSDGKLDVAYAGGYLVGEGTGQFTQNVFLHASSGLTAAGDLNGDGKLDLAVSGYREVGFGSNAGLSVVFGNGTGKYTSSTTLSQQLLSGLVVGDFNKDGKADIAATDYSTGLFVFLSAATPADTLVVAGGVIDASLQPGGLTLDLSKGTLQVGGQSQRLSGSYREIRGTEQGDRITGSKKAESLDGIAGNDVIVGLDGNDFLNGGLGSDTLTGGKGKDQFVLANGSYLNDQFTAFDRAMGVDKITDFERGMDTITLYRDTLTAFTSRRISFTSVATQKEAQKSKALLTYITKTGSLFYNQNGAAGGFGSGGLFADFTNGLSLRVGDFKLY